jgi:amino acid permease
MTGVFRVLLAGVAATGLVVAPPAAAESDTPPGCVSQFWMVGLRATTRIICDGPLNPDGGWMRARAFYAPAYISDGYSSCYGSGYWSNCVYTAPREVAEYDVRDYYPVTPTTVLPDEPGYIGTGAVT